jgi:hypothetical protein
MEYYSTVEDVIKYSGVNYEHLGFASESKLETLVGNYLKQVKSLIDRNRGRDLIRDLDFGDKVILANAEKKWTGVNCTVKITTLDTYETNIMPYYGDVYAVNEWTITDTGELIAYTAVNEDLSKAKTLDLDVMSYDRDLENGELKIVLSDDEECSNIIKTIDLPLLYQYEWKKCRSYLGMDTSLSNIKSIGIKQTNIGNYLYVGNVYTKVIPEGIHNIAMRACANMVKLAYLNRESPVIRIEDLNATLVVDQILTPELKAELRMYAKKPNFNFSRVEGKINEL